MSDPDQNSNKPQQRGHGHAGISETITNMAKTCMGTGCLALPFAAKEGGYLLHVFGLLGIGIWNALMVDRLVRTYDLMHNDDPVLEHTTTTRRTNVAIDLYEETLPLKQQQQQQQSFRTASATSDDSTQSYQSTSQEEDGGSSGEEANENNTMIPQQNNKEEQPPPGTTTLVKLAWYALGKWGAFALDIIMVLYLCGVILAYLNAMRSFLSDTWFTTGIGFVDAFLLVAIMGPLSVVEHTGRLAKASAMGLLVLLATFLVIAWYGFFVPPSSDDYDDPSTDHEETWHVLTGDASIADTPTTTAAAAAAVQQEFIDMDYGSMWFPDEGIAGVSQWFGIVVFGFGVAPLTFSFHQAMEEPQYLMRATWWAMLIVAGCYIVIGVGLLYPFPDIGGDVLHELPCVGWIPTLTRLAMVLVVLVTAPLLIVPCGEILEGKLMGLLPHDPSQSGGDVEEEEEQHHHGKSQSASEWRLKAGVRWSICLACAAISTFVPGFVNVLSFVGCCCVAVVGFCVPPFLHFIISLQKARPCHRQQYSSQPLCLDSALAVPLFFDVIMFLWGLLATVVSTVYTFREISSTEK